ncbi:NADPH-dependent 7-cyano-7-deazaguanine reductase QueF [Aliikangiella sp. IMCC44632]
MNQIPLGKPTPYVSHYSPELLFPIARKEKRDQLNQAYLNFQGKDLWTGYEVSWLNSKGLPQIAIGEFKLNADSPNIVESKSFKLYLNSFNQTRFDSMEQVASVMQRDLTQAAGGLFESKLYAVDKFAHFNLTPIEGVLLDNLDVEIDTYQYCRELLAVNETQTDIIEETLLTHLLKSNCLITNQPDWASLVIRYKGKPVNKERLLKYIISFRSHNEFHEQCVERIFADIKELCGPEKLTVYARYTRRGGLDINPWRSDFESDLENIRLARQ